MIPILVLHSGWDAIKNLSRRLYFTHIRLCSVSSWLYDLIYFSTYLLHYLSYTEELKWSNGVQIWVQWMLELFLLHYVDLKIHTTINFLTNLYSPSLINSPCSFYVHPNIFFFGKEVRIIVFHFPQLPLPSVFINWYMIIFTFTLESYILGCRSFFINLPFTLCIMHDYHLGKGECVTGGTTVQSFMHQ